MAESTARLRREAEHSNARHAQIVSESEAQQDAREAELAALRIELATLRQDSTARLESGQRSEAVAEELRLAVKQLKGDLKREETVSSEYESRLQQLDIALRLETERANASANQNKALGERVQHLVDALDSRDTNAAKVRLLIGGQDTIMRPIHALPLLSYAYSRRSLRKSVLLDHWSMLLLLIGSLSIIILIG